MQNTTQQTKCRATRTALKTGGDLRCSGRVGSPASTSGTYRVTVVGDITSLYLVCFFFYNESMHPCNEYADKNVLKQIIMKPCIMGPTLHTQNLQLCLKSDYDFFFPVDTL